jgi:small subunit ribosomal protein S8
MEGNVKKVLRVFLKYGPRRQPAIHGIRRASHAGRRTYVRSDRIPRVLDGLGIAILSTSVGVLTDREARKRHVGGELICTVW